MISEQPLVLFHLYTGASLSQSEEFCKFWSVQDFVLGGIILMLMSYGSVERNLLIFYRPFLFRHLIVLHHVPIVLCIVYPLVFYTSIIYGYPCVNALDYTMNLCGGPCFTFDRVPSVLDLLVNLALVELIGVFANIVLVTRVSPWKASNETEQ